MGVSVALRLDAELATGVWSDLSADLVAVAGMSFRYGIEGNSPSECVAYPGEFAFVLRNDAGNSGGVQGYYSPNHASKRSGWTFGKAVRLAFRHGSESVKTVSNLTRSVQTATATVTSHGYSTGQWVTIAGANQAEYNGVFQITVLDANTFTFTVSGAPATPATGTITSTKTYVKFRGKIRAIDPIPGQYRQQHVLVTAYDHIHDLLEADARQVTFQSNKTEAELQTAVLNVLPAAAQPPAQSLGPALDVYPWAFDNLSGGAKALALLADVGRSAQGWIFCKGDGTYTYKNRQELSTVASSYTFANSMHGLAVPSSLDGVFNRVRITIHPRTIDAAATTVLWAQTGPAPEIAPGQTQEIWGDYRDPNDPSVKIGGTEQVVPIVATTDYTGNSSADGTGNDLTSSLAIVTTAFGSTAKFTVTNNGIEAVFVTKLQIRGKGVYDLAPQTFESYQVQDYGDRPLELDLPLQDDANIAQALADYIRTQRQSLTNDVDEIEFLANDHTDLLTQALAREPGDRISLTEAVTGLSAAEALIRSVSFEVGQGPRLTVRWGLFPASVVRAFTLDSATLGILDTNALGYA